MVIIKEDIPGNCMCFEKASVKVISIGPTLCQKRCLLWCAYNPKIMLIKSLNVISRTREGFSILRDFKINPSRPDLGQREKIKLNFYFHTSFWCLERFYEGL